jgi:hypothetical protein
VRRRCSFKGKVIFVTAEYAEEQARRVEAKFGEPYSVYACKSHYHLKHTMRQQSRKHRGKYVVCDKCGDSNKVKRADMHRCTIIRPHIVDAIARANQLKATVAL